MLDYFMYTYGNQILLVTLCTIFGLIGHGLRSLLNKYLTDETKREIAVTVMEYVEQVFTDIHGEEKMAQALKTAETLLAKHGINFDAEEMEVLIEQAVKEFNMAFNANA